MFKSHKKFRSKLDERLFRMAVPESTKEDTTTGLIVKGDTPEENQKIGSMLREPEAQYHAEWVEDGQYWLFPEEESTYDALEQQLTLEFTTRGICASFEGVFSENYEFGYDDKESIKSEEVAPFENYSEGINEARKLSQEEIDNIRDSSPTVGMEEFAKTYGQLYKKLKDLEITKGPFLYVDFGDSNATTVDEYKEAWEGNFYTSKDKVDEASPLFLVFKDKTGLNITESSFDEGFSLTTKSDQSTGWSVAESENDFSLKESEEEQIENRYLQYKESGMSSDAAIKKLASECGKSTDDIFNIVFDVISEDEISKLGKQTTETYKNGVKEPATPELEKKKVELVNKAVQNLQKAVASLQNSPKIDWFGEIPYYIEKIKEILSSDNGEAGIEKYAQNLGKKFSTSPVMGENEMEEKKISKGEDAYYITTDWKDTEGVFKAMIQTLPKLGVFVYSAPSFEGTDSYALIVSRKKFGSNKQAEAAAMGMSVDEFNRFLKGGVEESTMDEHHLHSKSEWIDFIVANQVPDKSYEPWTTDMLNTLSDEEVELLYHTLEQSLGMVKEEPKSEMDMKFAPIIGEKKQNEGTNMYGTTVKPRELREGETYTWTEGAELLDIKFVGRSEQHPEIIPGVSIGKGFIFQFVDSGSYLEIASQVVMESVIKKEMDEEFMSSNPTETSIDPGKQQTSITALENAGFQFEDSFLDTNGNDVVLLSKVGKMGAEHAQVDPDGTVNGNPLEVFMKNIQEGKGHGETVKDKTDYIMFDGDEFWIDSLDPDTQNILTIPGEAICFEHEGKKYTATVSNEEPEQSREDGIYKLLNVKPSEEIDLSEKDNKSELQAEYIYLTSLSKMELSDEQVNRIYQLQDLLGLEMDEDSEQGTAADVQSTKKPTATDFPNPIMNEKK